MPDIAFDFPVHAPAAEVFARFATPAGLASWWTLRTQGTPSLGETWHLDFGPGFDWRARVTACQPPSLFELTLTHSMDDWLGSRVRVELEEADGTTSVRFRHAGWPAESDHFRTSSFCWAMYLRHMRRHAETGIVVPYHERLDA
jgi:uncharacterized protein YndB with AHSA1/START domain